MKTYGMETTARVKMEAVLRAAGVTETPRESEDGSRMVEVRLTREQVAKLQADPRVTYLSEV